MSNKRNVYVGGFDDNVTKEHLYACFGPFGDILDLQLPLETTSNKNRGFATIEYELIEDAESAIDNMNNSELFGKVLTVHVTKSFLEQRDGDGNDEIEPQ